MVWHVILCYELGEDFSVTVIAKDIEGVQNTIAKNHPESSIVAITSKRLAGAP